MSNYLSQLKMQSNLTYTENGAKTLRSTGSSVLDLFGTIGALRHADSQDILGRFIRAYAEDHLLSMKILFYARDIRGGLGERRTFQLILLWLADNEPDVIKKNLKLIPEFGRWDDLMVLFGTECEAAAVQTIRDQLDKDWENLKNGESVSLLGKWMPSINASDPVKRRLALKLADRLNMRPAEYRKMLSKLRAAIDLTENYLREMNYSLMDYEKQPSKAMLKYRKAFLRNDGENYQEYLRKVSSGQAKMNTGTLMPYELIREVFGWNLSDEERKALDVTWNALPDYCDGRNAIAVIDGSRSMYGNYDDYDDGNPRPIDVALSLGIYFAEHNTGPFHNHFITFSENPCLVEIKGADLKEKVEYCATYNEIANTNIQKVFELILQTALSMHAAQRDMPETVYIISDMEFDRCTKDADLTNFEYAEQIFKANGYQLPQLVFWNVQSRHHQVPVSMNDRGVALVSGASASIFSMAMEGDPYSYMLKVLNAERYQSITV